MTADHRTAQAKKWADNYLPPETCGGIEVIQNDLELLRDANSQLRHAAHYYRHRAEAAEATLSQALDERDEASAQLTKTTIALRDTIRLMMQYAREAGEAKGRLEMSEAAGIVEGWRERAEAAEAKLALFPPNNNKA